MTIIITTTTNNNNDNSDNNNNNDDNNNYTSNNTNNDTNDCLTLEFQRAPATTPSSAASHDASMLTYIYIYI